MLYYSITLNQSVTLAQNFKILHEYVVQTDKMKKRKTEEEGCFDQNDLLLHQRNMEVSSFA